MLRPARALTLAAGLALAASPLPALAQVCGDVNASGTVTSGDALSVLKKAVGQDVTLTCSGDCAALDPRVTDLEDALASTQASLASAQEMIGQLQELLAGVSRDGSTIVMSGVNLQVVDGSGNTSGPVNGLGNVIIGYNEGTAGQARTGSHNLVVGAENDWTSFGGIVAGESNSITARAASVIGGNGNEAGGSWATVCGGSGNTASGSYSSVGGGSANTASGSNASVGGGFSNTSSGPNAAISGGCEGVASNTYASVSGGQGNLASGFWSSVTGGYGNKATASHSAVSGGSTRTANTTYNWRAGSLSELQ